jgi:hypothetical protein
MGWALGVLVICPAFASAAEGLPSEQTLTAMGLSGIEMMTDEDAMAVRGMGYRGADGYKKQTTKQSYASASGHSWAKLEIDGRKIKADAGTRNRYDAHGKYYASGVNYSKASKTITETRRVSHGYGKPFVEVKTYKISVEAFGYSSAKAF